jgi:hypothetical protein
MNDPVEFEAPKRGEQINHGENQASDYTAETDTQAEPLMEPDWSEDNPIPVYIVHTPEVPQITDWSSERFVITETAVNVAGSRRNRKRAVVKNEGPDPVYIDPGQGVGSAFSYGLKLDEEIELKNNGAIWARCDATDTATLSIVQEYDVPLDIERHV